MPRIKWWVAVALVATNMALGYAGMALALTYIEAFSFLSYNEGLIQGQMMCGGLPSPSE